MSAQSLGSRAIIGEFYKTLQMDQSGGWVDAVSMMFQSDQDAETYKWLGQIPQMREWIGGRQAQGFSDQGVTLTNVHYESTLEVLKREDVLANDCEQFPQGRQGTDQLGVLGPEALL